MVLTVRHAPAACCPNKKLSSKQFDFRMVATEARGCELRFAHCSGGVQQKLEVTSCALLVAQAPALCFALHPKHGDLEQFPCRCDTLC